MAVETTSSVNPDVPHNKDEGLMIIQKLKNKSDVVWEAEQMISEDLIDRYRALGKEEKDISYEEGEAITALLGLSNSTDEEKNTYRKDFPELAQIIDQMMSSESVVSWKKLKLELDEEKKEYALQLTIEAKRRFSHLIARIDYTAVLNNEDSDSVPDQFELMANDVKYLADISQQLEKKFEHMSEQYDVAEYVYLACISYEEKYKQYWLTEEVVSPLESEVSEALEAIRLAPEEVKKIDFHNDLQGVLLGENYSPYSIATPGILRNVGLLLRQNSESDLHQNPYFVIALARKIEQTLEALGPLHKRKTWVDTLDVDAIYRFIDRKSQQLAEIQTDIAARAIDGMIERYIQIHGKHPTDRLPSDILVKEIQLVEALQQLRRESAPMIPSDERILQSQLVSLHYLFSSGGIDVLYEKYVEKISEDELPKDEEAKHKIQAELALIFLHKIEKKNKESIFQWSSEAPTLGAEYEFPNTLEKLVFNRKKFASTASLLKEYLQSGLTEEMKNSREFKQILQELYLKESLNNEGISQMILTLDSQIREIDDIVVGQRNRNETEEIPQEQLSEFYLYQSPSPSILISSLGAFKIDKSTAPLYRELITQPTSSYRMQLRELVYTLISSNLTDTELNPHMTVGNVELSPERPEASDIRAIIESSGLFDSDIPDEAAELILNGQNLFYETFSKYSRFDGELYYLNCHQIRWSGEMSRLNTRWIPTGFELRSFIEKASSPKSFTNRVRVMAFINLSSYGVKSGQLRDFQRNAKEMAISVAWDKCIEEWKSVLLEVNIDYLPLEQRFCKVSLNPGKSSFDLLSPDLYGLFLSRLTLEAHRNPEFAKKVRAVMRRFNFQVRTIIGDNSASKVSSQDN